MKKITVVLGTAREGNFSERVSSIVVDHLKEKNFDVTFVDIKNFLFGKTTLFSSNTNLVKPWADIVSKSDSFIFISPEYNHSFPGELKILIDSLFEEYKGKVSGIVSISEGQFAGVRAAEALKILLHTVNFKITKLCVNVSHVQLEIDEEKIKKHLNSMVDEMRELLQ